MEEVILELLQDGKSESYQCRTSLVLGKGSLGFKLKFTQSRGNGMEGREGGFK